MIIQVQFKFFQRSPLSKRVKIIHLPSLNIGLASIRAFASATSALENHLKSFYSSFHVKNNPISFSNTPFVMENIGPFAETDLESKNWVILCLPSILKLNRAGVRGLPWQCLKEWQVEWEGGFGNRSWCCFFISFSKGFTFISLPLRGSRSWRCQQGTANAESRCRTPCPPLGQPARAKNTLKY